METEKIVQFINEDLNLGLHNWRVEALAGDHRLIAGLFPRDPDNPSVVTLRAKWKNVDTGAEYARHGYPDVINLSRSVVLTSWDIRGEDELMMEVHGLLTRAFSHEVFEGMRVRSRDNRAPFHPHRRDGLEAGGEELSQIAFLTQVTPRDLTPAMIEETRSLLPKS